MLSKTAHNARSVHKRKPHDRRVERTRKALREALHALVARKPYDEITLAEVLALANVGRSTFYLHFRDKDDLLASTIADVMNAAGAAPARGARFPDRILWFSLPVFEYHAHRRRAEHHRMGDHGKTVLHRHLGRAIGEAIDERIQREFRDAELMKRFVVSSFILVLDWWLEGNGRASPEQAEATFRSLVEPTLLAKR